MIGGGWKAPRDHFGRAIRRPYPWERDVTVCIAAACKDEGQYKIVLCTDRRIGGPLGSSEAGYKDYRLEDGWRCLIAGNEADIMALVRLYADAFSVPENLTPDKLDETIKLPLRQRKRGLVEEYIRSQLAISYDDFYSRGKERLPDDVFREMTQRIRMIQPNAEVIVAGISNNSPEIYFTDSEWTVRAAHDFAVVGEGENLAVASLLRREQHAWNPLLTTLYNVFEAKKNCHTVPSVGTKTFLAVLTQGEYRMVSLALERHLDQRYRAYNPPVEKDDLKFDGEYYFRNEQEG